MNDDHLAEMKALAEVGDISLAHIRRVYANLIRQDCTLSDDDVLRCFGWQDDAYGDEDVVRRMVALQYGNKDKASMEGECT